MPHWPPPFLAANPVGRRDYAAVVFLRNRRAHPLRRLVGCVILVIMLAAVPGIATRIIGISRIYSVKSVPAKAVGMVLGAGVEPGGEPSAFLQGRIDVAARLWRADKITAIIVSGNREPYYDEPRAMRKGLIAQGVPRDAIVEDPAGFDTYDSCVRARDVYGVDDLIVISQTYHLPRAVTTCELVGVDAIGVGDDSVRQRSLAWSFGEVREFAASWKMVADVLSAREPVRTPESDSVQEILARAKRSG